MPNTIKTKTTLGRAWKIKTLIFTVALLALGIWGAYDALSVYPNRGRIHSEFMLEDYLELADAQLQIGAASVLEPRTELDRLAEAPQLNDLERSRLAWLESLSKVTNLSAIERENAQALENRASPSDPLPESPTVFPDPRTTLLELNALNKNRGQPSPLTAYDLPLQYLFMIGGFAGFVWMLLFFIRVNAKSFRYDPDERRLTLPDGRAFTPDEIEVVDKRKWDKFIVYVTLKGSPDEIRLDLYRYDPLESWIIEMEKLSPNYEASVEEGEEILCVNVIDAAPIIVVPDEGTALPVGDAQNRLSIYPALRTVDDQWYVVGAAHRASLKEAAEGDLLDRSELKVDLATFRVSVASVPDEIPTIDLRPEEEPDEGDDQGA